MEIIRIGDERLKIMLSARDREKYKIDTELSQCDLTDDGGDIAAKKILIQILDDAKYRDHFITPDAKLLVELFCSRNGGGCELFVTCMGAAAFCEYDNEAQEGPTEKDHSDTSLTPAERQLLRRVGRTDGKNNFSSNIQRDRKVPAKAKKIYPIIFEFPSLNEIISASRRLLRIKFSDDSKAYISDSGVCYLVLLTSNASPFRLPDKYAFLGEYGQRIIAHRFDDTLCEHLSLLCSAMAVEKLGRC